MIVIVDYGAGNLTSVKRAVSYLGYDSVITGDSKKIATAERIIFPGVGAAGAAMEVMQQRGIDRALKQAFASKIPMLGICVGCQIIMDRSEENDAACLGLIKGEAKAFLNNMAEISLLDKAVDETYRSINSEKNVQRYLKVPHMGWNGLDVVQPHLLFNGIKPEDEFYFVHSYFPMPVDESSIYGKTEYGIQFASAIGKDNLFATQFHLEKSGEPGLLILKNFCLWKP
ncbi:MAG: imidazole glycerol phosphate synthase subunit HisH [Desulfamplus sp.]|nr:imidazole glycerol phosphate synthase subunit HisH [Desulfamplus sp.]